jgi:hypothetical protein
MLRSLGMYARNGVAQPARAGGASGLVRCVEDARHGDECVALVEWPRAK